jgi:transcriptional regulator with XRE-family HTH domain
MERDTMALTLGQFVRQRREALGERQIDLADRAGIGRAWLSHIEHDLIPEPSIFRMVRLAEALDIGFGELGGYGDRQRSPILERQIEAARVAASDLLASIEEIERIELVRTQLQTAVTVAQSLPGYTPQPSPRKQRILNKDLPDAAPAVSTRQRRALAKVAQ